MNSFAVILHSTGPQGGYVVRTISGGSLAAPYRIADAVRVYGRERDARRLADKMNGAPA